MWVVTSARDYSARPLERVCGFRFVCKLTMPVTSSLLYLFSVCSSCFFCFAIKSLHCCKCTFIHRRGHVWRWATHQLILRLFQWSNKDSRLISALKMNSSRGTGGRCTTRSPRRTQSTGQRTATRGRASSAGTPPPSVRLEGGMILWRTEIQTSHFCASFYFSEDLNQEVVIFGSNWNHHGTFCIPFPSTETCTTHYWKWNTSKQITIGPL